MKKKCDYCGKPFGNKLLRFSAYGRTYHPKCWFVVQERLEKFIDILCSSDEEFKKWLTQDGDVEND